MQWKLKCVYNNMGACNSKIKNGENDCIMCCTTCNGCSSKSKYCFMLDKLGEEIFDKEMWERTE